jgi:hypothetical protein
MRCRAIFMAVVPSIVPANTNALCVGLSAGTRYSLREIVRFAGATKAPENAPVGRIV